PHRRVGPLISSFVLSVLLMAACEPATNTARSTPPPPSQADAFHASPSLSGPSQAVTLRPNPKFGFTLRHGRIPETGAPVSSLSGLTIPADSPHGVSHDGTRIAYWSGGAAETSELRVVDVLTGSSRSLFALPPQQRGAGIAWSTDDRGVVAAGVSKASSAGIPEGKRAVYSSIHVLDLDSGERREVARVPYGSAALAWDRASGDIVLAAGRVLDGTSLRYEVIHQDGTAAIRVLQDVCAVDVDSRAAVA